MFVLWILKKRINDFWWVLIPWTPPNDRLRDIIIKGLHVFVYETIHNSKHAYVVW